MSNSLHLIVQVRYHETKSKTMAVDFHPPKNVNVFELKYDFPRSTTAVAGPQITLSNCEFVSDNAVIVSA